MKVNDGNGLYDNEGVCEAGILALNNAVKNLTAGQYIAFCDGVSQVAKILANLKNGIKEERVSNEQTIEELKRQNAALQEQLEQKGKV